ncbi:hypothetical protein INR49_025864 [Caranx melampygus]|nr:hypothetical protein INR49_025864 [Caranx melampygus]
MIGVSLGDQEFMELSYWKDGKNPQIEHGLTPGRIQQGTPSRIALRPLGLCRQRPPARRPLSTPPIRASTGHTWLQRAASLASDRDRRCAGNSTQRTDELQLRMDVLVDVRGPLNPLSEDTHHLLAGLTPSRRKRQRDTTRWQAAGKDKLSSDSLCFSHCCLGSGSLSGLTGLSMLLGRVEVPKDSYTVTFCCTCMASRVAMNDSSTSAQTGKTLENQINV